MKIAIDISQIVYGTGVSFYTRNLVKALAKIDKKNDYVLFGSSLRLKNILQEFATQVNRINKNFSSKIITFPPTLIEALGNRFRFLPVEKLIGKFDVFHSSDWTQPLTKAAKVTTIHDFGFMRYPNVSHPKIAAVMKRRLTLVKNECDLIIAVSEATKKDAVKLLKIPTKKIRVVYEAAFKDFKRASKKEIEQVKKKYKIKGKYFLCVATLEPRKNFKRIIKAFSKFKTDNPGFVLVIVGKFGWGDIKISKPAARDSFGNIKFTGYVPSEDLPGLYSGASCLVYPSLYEGFGLPILEAFACGCPVLTSNISSMSEVAGKAAVLVNPLDTDDIARGMKEAIEKRERLIKAGLNQVKQFSWEKAAKETLKIYEEVVR